ncbi:hypothetical protein FBU30_010869 [Linnemannia zychae]|nr:hypothetical protein FBU30_010869 [Linnemannia zychae]
MINVRRNLLSADNGPHRQGIVPDHILRHLSESADVDTENRESAHTTLQQSLGIREGRQELTRRAAQTPRSVQRKIYDAEHITNTEDLPGQLVREKGDPPTLDADVNSCYDNFGITFGFYNNIFGRDSVNNMGLPLVGSVHFGDKFQNAFWDGNQMIFGDGGTFIYHFCQSLDVIAHELTHGVTQYTAGLQYQGQSGALNESCSDVFGSMVRQFHANETVENADWLIGEDCLFPGVKGVALRSLRAPGTAYNDPRVGSDPQVATMNEYQNLQDNDDSGGVHINSGIPNHAFYLTAIGFGGHSWERAGPIWYDTLTGRRIPRNCDFKTFANATCDSAQRLYGSDAEAIVRNAWTNVGVL